MTARFATEQERSSRAIAEANALLEQGVISHETHARAIADATGAAAAERREAEASAKAMAARSAILAEGVSVTQSVRTAEERHAAELQRLGELLAADAISQETYARSVAVADNELRQASGASRDLADAVAAGAAMTARFQTEEERSARAIAEANALLSQGVISHETHSRAMAEATGAAAAERRELEAAGKQMAEMAAVFQDGAATTRSVQTAEERHAEELNRLRGLLAAGAISQQTYARAVDKADDELRQASGASRGLGAATAAASAGVERLAGKLNTLIALNAAQLFGQASAAVSGGVRSLVSMASAEAEVVDQTSKLGRRLGLTYGEMAGLQLAGDLAGVGVETIANAATKADVAFVKAARGSQLAQQALDGVGLSVEELQNKTPAERFQMMADAIAALPTPAERAAAAVRLFGRSGAELLPLFEAGAGSIQEATDEANRFGLALTNEQGQAVENMNDAFKRASSSVQGVVQQVVAYLAPAIQNVSDTFANLVGSVGGANIGQAIGNALLSGAEFLATIADGVVAGLSDTWAYASQVGDYWNTVWDMGNRVAAALSGVFNVGKVALGSVVLGLGVAVESLARIGQKIGQYLRFDTSSLDSFVEGSRAFNDSIVSSMNDAAASAASDFATAFSESKASTEAPQKGPISTAVADAIRQARENAAAVNKPEKTTLVAPQPAVVSAPSTQAVQAVDSRSSQGLAEMFRLMRGGGDDVQEQQLGVLEQIRDAVSSGDVEEIVSMAGA